MSKLILKDLSMKNFATFENQVIDFHQSFNGIIGETGSGKSLILDAFQLLLGQRADKKLVRKDTEFAVIEGTFSVEKKNEQAFFDELGFPLEESEVVIKRIIYATGKSKCFLNHLNCPLNTIKVFAKNYIDLVGQFENQKLASSDYQLKLIDLAAKNTELINQYHGLYNDYKEVRQRIESIVIDQIERERKEDYLRYQLEELSQVELNKELEEELNHKKNAFLNKEDNLKATQSIQGLANEDDHNISTMLGSIRRIVSSHPSVLSDDAQKNLEATIASFDDFTFNLGSQNIDSNDSESLEEIMTTLDNYQKLKRKYHCDTEGLVKLQDDMTNELASLNKLDHDLESLKKKSEMLQGQLETIAMKLHDERKKCAISLAEKITIGLKSLNMKGATFIIDVDKTQTLSSSGLSQVNFMAETNKGEGFYSIHDIASGGELSRILLTLRNIVSTSDSISIFFFDEIDTGIGGETAKLIAKKLKELSVKSQILAITHLPQIAKVTDKLIYVDKKSLDKDSSTRTISFVSEVTGSKREKVINQLAGL
jgi:DNA repair protein RecN (Recombination protein N)